MVWNPKSDYSTPRSQFIKWELVPYTRGRGLDVGCGAIKPFPHFIGIDVKEFQAGGMTIKPDMNMDATDLSIFASQSLDFVFSSHALQWIEDYKKALREAWRVLKPWGHLVLYMPDRRLYEYPKKEGQVLPHLFTPDDMIEAMKELKGWNLIVNDQHAEEDEYSFFQVYFKTKNEKHQFAYREPKPEKTACVVRYGAFGDLMQTSPIIAGLKAEGYHVTLQSSPPGLDVVRFDPNIDHLQVQDKDQVPNVELGQYWAWCKKKYTKFVNLSSSVEGALLAEHDRMMPQWPHEARHALLDHNYVEHAHRIAGLKTRYPVKFHANEAEKTWAKKTRAGLGDPVILWSLAGSAVHKTWPYLDQIIARVLLTFPNASIVLCGGPESEMLEAGWENEKRVVRTCGKWNIRQSLAFLAEADLVIGPETGVLNASADMDVEKIIFLSHSSVENLTRDWKNCTSLTPKNTPCYPCHILHQGWEFCHKDEEKGVAKCQSDIDADECWEHVNRILNEKMLKAA
jgi:ADP-heptose:LPS heptosyltransferase/SAM-dependent methyltransferase